MIEPNTVFRRVLFWFVFYVFTISSLFAWIVFKIVIKAFRIMGSENIFRRVLFWFVFYVFTISSLFAWIVFKITIKAIYRDL